VLDLSVLAFALRPLALALTLLRVSGAGTASNSIGSFGRRRSAENA